MKKRCYRSYYSNKEEEEEEFLCMIRNQSFQMFTNFDVQSSSFVFSLSLNTINAAIEQLSVAITSPIL